MAIPKRKNNSSSRLSLSAVQRRTIDTVANTLSPPQRHSFLLRVGGRLKRSAFEGGFVTDDQVANAIEDQLEDGGGNR